MPRATKIITLAALAVAAAWALASGGGGSARAATGYAINIKVSDDIYTVACDGVDSFRITATVTLDGAPVSGAEVSAGGGVVGRTNRRGVLKFDYAPPHKDGYPKTSVYVSAVVANGTSVGTPMPLSFSCPFPSGPYVLNARLFHDHNGDGVRDRRDSALADRDVRLSLPGNSLLSSLNPRGYHLDANGRFSTSLYTGGYDAPRQHWSLCLTERDERHVIGSVNGIRVEVPGRCVELTQLAAGANDFSIGVVRR